MLVARPVTVAFSTPAEQTLITGPAIASFSVTGSCSENGRQVTVSGAAAATPTCTQGSWSATVDLTAAPDGPITLHADHQRADGTAAPQATRTFVKSVAGVFVTFVSPDAGAFINQANVSAFQLSGTCSTSGSAVTLSGGLTATTACTAGQWQVSADVSTAPEGALTVLADHQNAQGVMAVQASRSFVKDTTAPTLTISSPTNGAIVNTANQATFTVSGTCSEAGRTVSISGAASGSDVCTAGSFSVSVDLTPAAVGALSLTASHADAAGNSTSASVSVVKDLSAPGVAITSPAANSYVNAAGVTMFTVSGTCTLDGRPVILSGARTGMATCMTGTWTLTFDMTSVPEGPFSLTANHASAAGVMASPDTRAFIKDTVAPTLASVTVSNASPTNTRTWGLTWGAQADAFSDVCILENSTVVSGCNWQPMSTLPTSTQVSATEGAKQLTVYLRDAAGNVSTAVTSTSVTLQTTGPTLSAFSVTTPSPTRATTWQLQYGIVMGTPTQFCILENSTVNTTCAWQTFPPLPLMRPLLNTTDGAKTLSLWLRDAATNVSPRYDANAVTLDTTAPVLGSVAVTNSTPTNTLTYGLNWGAISEPFTSLCIQENSTDVSACSWQNTSALPASFQVSPTQNSKVLTAWVRDAAGNVSNAVSSNAVTLLTAGPTLASLTLDGPNPSNQISWTLSYGAITGTPTQWCLKYNDISTTGCVWINLPLTSVFSVGGGTPDTTFTVSMWLRDAAMNLSPRVDSNSMTLDRTPPTIGSFKIENRSPTTSRTYLLTTSNISEAISAYCLNENDTNVANCTWVSASAVPSSRQVSATVGPKALTLWVRDLAGNTQVVGATSNTVTYDPAMTLTPATTNVSSSGFITDTFEGQRFQVATASLNNGKILYAGGCNTFTNGPNIFYQVAKLYDPVADTWARAGQLSVARCAAATVTLADGRVLIAGGTTSNTSTSAAVDLYSPTTNSWQRLPSMRLARGGATATLLPSGKVLIAGGYANMTLTAQVETEIYDPVANVWVDGPALSTGRAFHSAVARSDGSVMLIGGQIAMTDTTASTEIFTPSGHSGTITPGPALTDKRASMAAYLLSPAESPTGAESIIVLAGTDGVNPRASVELFNGTSWATKTPITGARTTFNSVKFANGTIFVHGGLNGSTPLGTAGIYDPKGSAGAGTFTAKASSGTLAISGIVGGGASTTLLANGSVLEVYGNTTTGGGNPNTYTPGTDSWSNGGTAHESYPSYGQNPGPHLQLASGNIMTCGWRSNITNENNHCMMMKTTAAVVLPTADPNASALREFASMTELADGRVLVAGGVSNGFSVATNTAELYDPVSDTWATTGLMPRYAYSQQAARIPSNRVLLTGGWMGTAFNNASTGLRSFIYDVAANTWSSPATANLPSITYNHAMIRTPSGRVFLYGGSNGTTSLNRLLEWNDATTSWSTRASSAIARQGPAAVYVPIGPEGRIVVVGGFTTLDANPSGVVEQYEIGTDTWSTLAPLPSGGTTAHNCISYVPGTNELMLVGNGFGAVGFASLYRYSVAGNAWSSSATGLVGTPNRSDMMNGMSCGTLPDNRFWSVGQEYAMVHLVTPMLAPIRFFASGGDGVYTFTIASGPGSIDARGVYTPAFPLASGTTVVRVSDSTAATATATVTVP